MSHLRTMLASGLGLLSTLLSRVPRRWSNSLSKSRRKRPKKSMSSGSRRSQAAPASSNKKTPGPGKRLPYRTLGGACLHPAVSLALFQAGGQELSAKVIAIVDSGADCAYFPKEWAPALGIDCDTQCVKFKGATAAGACDQYLYEPGLKAKFLGKTVKLGAIFSEGCGAALMGREDFFRYFANVTFEQEAEVLDLQSAEDWDATKKNVEAAWTRLSTAIRREAEREAAEAATAASP